MSLWGMTKSPPTNVANNRNHHYVAQFYLRNFSDIARSVSVYNLRSGQYIARASIKGQCQRPYLYGKTGATEQALAEFEGVAASTIRTIIARRAAPHKATAAYVDLMLFVVTQHGRTTYAGEEYNEFSDKYWKHVLRPTLPRDGVTQEDLDDVIFEYPDAVGRSLARAAEIYPLVLDLRPILLVNDTNNGFITSDDPVILYNQFLEERRSVSNTGFQSVGLQIILPLSPTCALLFLDPSVCSTFRQATLRRLPGQRRMPRATLKDEQRRESGVKGTHDVISGALA